MNLQTLENDETIKDIVTSIMGDKLFYDTCQKNLKEIFEDNEINNEDIPNIINILLSAYVNYNKVNFNKKNTKKVLMLLLYKLINEFQTNKNINNEQLLLLIEPQIDLLLLNINISKCKWCSSRPLDEESVLNRVKLNNINKNKLKPVNILPNEDKDGPQEL